MAEPPRVALADLRHSAAFEVLLVEWNGRWHPMYRDNGQCWELPADAVRLVPEPPDDAFGAAYVARNHSHGDRVERGYWHQLTEQEGGPPNERYPDPTAPELAARAAADNGHPANYADTWAAERGFATAATPEEPVHEWSCPGCGATTRARMADRPPREPSPAAEDDADGSKGGAYFVDLLPRFGRCTCDPVDDGMGGVFGNCTELAPGGCALCKRLDPDWPCPTREHHGYPG